MVDNGYIQTMIERSIHHQSTSLSCGCELMVFDFSTDVRPRTLIHRCKRHEGSMVVSSNMSVFHEWAEKTPPLPSDEE